MDSVRIKTVMAPEGPRQLSVGRQRQVERTPQGVLFKLYSKPIVTLQGNKLTLDLCGYWTPAVCGAMKDYASAIGLDIKPSLSKGKFTAKYNGTIHEAGFDNRITIEVLHERCNRN